MAEADRLRAEIEAAGWKVVDRGTDFALSPAAAAGRDGRRASRYGRGKRAVAPRGAIDGLATVVLLATDWPDDLARALDGLRARRPTGRRS